jgi:hypothetical protein
MTRTLPLSLARMVVIGIGVSLLACGGGGESPGESARSSRVASNTDTPPGSRPPIDYDKIVAEADSLYTYGSEQAPSKATKPDEFDDTEDQGIDPQITFAKATPNGGATTYGTVIGRIVSSAELKKLKIHKDTNYLWREQAGGDVYTVPKDEPSKGKALKLGRAFTDTSPGHSSVTHLVKATKSKRVGSELVQSYAFGVCTDGCNSGHCGLQ